MIAFILVGEQHCFNVFKQCIDKNKCLCINNLSTGAAFLSLIDNIIFRASTMADYECHFFILLMRSLSGPWYV